MTREELNAFCASLPATTHIVQWGNADVWKVGGKVFAVCGWNGDDPAVSFKVTPLVFEVMGDAAGVRPAPYMASRGMKWLQVYSDEAMSAESLQDHIRASYDMIAAALTKKKRGELGLD